MSEGLKRANKVNLTELEVALAHLPPDAGFPMQVSAVAALCKALREVCAMPLKDQPHAASILKRNGVEL